MKIHDIGNKGGPQRPERPENGKSRTETARTNSVGTDRAELSSAARTRRALFEAAIKLPETRQELVDNLRQAIRKGDFVVDPERLARAIVEFEDDLR